MPKPTRRVFQQPRFTGDPDAIVTRGMSGDIQILRDLLAQGANPYVTDENGSPPLVLALLNGDIERFEILRAHRVLLPAHRRDLPIFRAVVGGHTPMVAHLLAQGDDINAADISGLTVLHELCKCHRPQDRTLTEEMARFLLDHGADPTLRDQQQRTCVHEAAERALPWLCRLFFSHGGATDPFIAAALGDIETLHQWLSLHPDAINMSTDDGRTPLHWAAAAGRCEVIKLLLSRHADINARDEELETPLHRAAALRHSPAMELLIRSGADVNRRDVTGGTPLMHAALAGDAAAVTWLLDARALLNLRNVVGDTALHDAAQMGWYEVAAILLARGADPTLLNVFKKSPLDIAAAGNHAAMAGMLKKARPG